MHPEHPMMVHGAYLSGRIAAERVLETAQARCAATQSVSVAVIGAGAAGCGALRTLKSSTTHLDVCVLEGISVFAFHLHNFYCTGKYLYPPCSTC